MPVQVLQTSFVSGELSPTMFGRADLDDYTAGAQKLRNVYLSSQGGVFRREGMLHIDNVNSNNPTRLIPFEFAIGVNYLLVFTDQRIDVYRDDALVHTLTGGVVADLTTSRIQSINYSQSGSTLIIVHEDIEPIRLVNGGNDTTWTADRVPFTYIPAFPFGSVTQTSKTSTLTFASLPGARQWNVTSTASDFTGTDQVGNNILFDSGIFEIIEKVSNTEVNVVELVEPAGGASGGSSNWILESGYEPVWSASIGWPVSVTFHQGRLAFGGSKGLPQGLWFSRSDDFFNFLPSGGDDDDTIFVTITADKVIVIRNLFSGRTLQIFTNSGEFFAGRSSDINRNITPSNISVEQSTQHGSSAVRPVSVDGATIFVERGGSVIRDFVFNEVEQSFVANNLSLLSQHLIRTPTRMDVRRSTTITPSDYVYILNSDGTIAVMNTLRNERLLGFTLFETEGVVEDIAVIDRDVYLTVLRDSTRRIEKLDETNFFDGGIKQSVSPAQTVWTGLTTLEGLDVGVRVGGFPVEDNTVTSGSITTSLDGETLNVGLKFFSVVETMPLDATLRIGSTLGEFKSLVKANCRLHETRGMVLKRVKPDGTEAVFKPPFMKFGSNVLDQDIVLFSGWKNIYIGGTGRDVSIKVTQDESSEFNLLSMVMEIKI